MKNLLFALVASLSLIFAPMAQAATPWLLGVFPPTTAYNGGYSSLGPFDTLMGVTQPAIENFYVDFNQDPVYSSVDGWRPSSQYNLNGFNIASDNGGPNNCTNPWFACSGVIPMGSLPMATAPGSSEAQTTVLSLDQYLQNISAGQYDSVWTGVVDDWSNAGYKTQYWRPGVEFNETGNIYDCGTDTQCMGYWRSAFQHIYTKMHAEASADGVTLQVIWNPGADAGGNVDPSSSSTYWPGAGYVDQIGVDLYDNAYPNSPSNKCPNYTNPASNATCDANASGGTAFGLIEALNFAKAQGKPIDFPETGTSNDNPYFGPWLAAVLKNSTTTVGFISLWDSNGGCVCQFTPSSAGKPNTAAGFASAFGNGVAGGGGGSSGGGSPSTPSPVGTEITGPIGQIEDSTSDIFKITLGNQITINGGISAGSANVLALIQETSGVIQVISGGAAYTVPSNGSAGTTTTVPSNYVAPHAESPIYTTISAGGTTPIYDPYGDAWLVSSSGTISVNGVAVASSGVQKLFLDASGLLDQLTGTGWYTQPEDGSTGVAEGTPTGYSSGAAAPVAISITPATQLSTVNDYGTVNPFMGVAINDTNSGQTETVTVTLGTPANGALSDPNAGTDGSTITGGVVHLSGTATAVATAINGLVFTPTNQGVIGTHATTVITIADTDTSGQTASATSTVTANQVSTAATLSSHC